MTTRYTPVYSIPVPGPDDKPKDASDQLWALGMGVESALAAAQIPGTSNPDIRVSASAAARDAYFGTPTTEAARLALQARSAIALRTDTGLQERYYATYNATSNKQGRAVPGWYPLAAFNAQYASTFNSSGTGVDGVGSLTLNTGTSSPMAASFFTPIANGLLLRNPGVYSFGFDFKCAPSMIGSRCFVDVTMNGVITRYGWNGPNEDQAAGGTPAQTVLAPGNATFGFYRNTSQAQSTACRIFATYEGPLA